MKRYSHRLLTPPLIMLVLGLTGFSTQKGFAQQHPSYTSFDNYTVQDGFPSNRVRAMMQDRQGFIWIGTEQGAVRFDGYNVTSINTSDTLDTPATNIGALFEDSAGNIWIGSMEGLVMYDPILETANHYTHIPDDSLTLSHNNVFSITETDEGILWIGTERGFNRLDRESGIVKRFYFEEFNTSSICGDIVTSIAKDKDNTLWLGTENGLCSFDPSTHLFAHWNINNQENQSAFIRTIQFDGDQMLWVGTPNGLYSFNIEHKQIERVTFPSNNSLPKSQSIISIGLNENALLIGTEAGNVFAKNLKSDEWLSIVPHNDSVSESTISEFAKALLIDNMGLLWIGGVG